MIKIQRVLLKLSREIPPVGRNDIITLQEKKEAVAAASPPLPPPPARSKRSHSEWNAVE